MSRYVLGAGAADWLRRAMASRDPIARKRGARLGAAAYPGDGRIPRAFEVHYAASSGTGSSSTPEGGWIVYLPTGCLRVDNAEVDASTGLLPAGGNWPTGWFRLGFVPAAAAWLNITFGGGTAGGATAAFAATKSGDLSVCLATVDGYEVTQLVVGALALGGGGASPQKWYNAAEIVTNANGDQVVKVSRVAAFSGALLVTGTNTELPLVEGMTVYLHVVLTVGTGGTLSGTVTVTDSARSTTPYTGDDYYIPIWHVAGGKLYDATIPGMTKRI